MEAGASWLFGLHLATTLAMAGVLWFVQLVHYPMLALVGAAGFAEFEREGVRRTTWVVGPLMLLEAASGAGLLLFRPPWLSLVALGLDLALWLAHTVSTAFVQVPLHGVLELGFDARAHRRLVLTNWARTLTWTARAGLLAAVTCGALPAS